MSTNYSGSTISGTIADNGTVTIQEPSDGDALTAASVNTALSKLADIVQWLVLNTAKRSSKTTPAENLVNPMPLQMGASALPQIQFDIPNFGVSGQRDQYRSQLWDFTLMNVTCGVYLNAAGNIEITAGCTWSYSLQKWIGVNFCAMLKIIPGGGMQLWTKDTGDEVNGWSDLGPGGGGWDAVIGLDPSSRTQGDVLGWTSGTQAQFGRPREALQNLTPGTGFAGGPTGYLPQGFKGPSGDVKLLGRIDSGGSIDISSAQTICAAGGIPDSLRPTNGNRFVIGLIYINSGGSIEPAYRAVPIEIGTDGSMSMNPLQTSSASAPVSIYLDGILFTP